MFTVTSVTSMDEDFVRIRLSRGGCRTHQQERLQVSGTQVRVIPTNTALYPPYLLAEAVVTHARLLQD